MENNKNNKKPIFEIIVLLIVIIPLIFISFICSSYKFEITASIIILICLLIVVLLSSSFDDFQIGKIISLKRNVSEYKVKNEKLENEKNELVKQLINFNIQSQHTSNMNFNGISLEDLKKGIFIEKASETEIKDSKSEEDKERVKNNKIESKEPEKVIDREKLEALVLKKCFGTINFGSIINDVKVNNKFNDIDPISNRTVIFDAFFNDQDTERFIEIQQYISPMFYDRLYVMLNKIYHYRKIKNSNSNLTLIIPKLPKTAERSMRPSFYSTDRLKEVFFPAISSGLLNVLEVEITEEEVNEVSDERRY